MFFFALPSQNTQSALNNKLLRVGEPRPPVEREIVNETGRGSRKIERNKYVCVIEDHGEEVPVRKTVGQSERY